MTTKKRVALIFVLIAAAALAVVAASLVIAATCLKSPSAIDVDIAQGASVRAISQELAISGVIRTPKLFEVLARARGLTHRLRAGTYEFSAGMSLLSVLDKIARGDVKQFQFTVIEGWTIKEIAAALSGQPFLSSPGMPAELVRLSSDPEFITAMGFEGAPSLEGFLFPDTYLFYRPTDAQAFLKRLVARFKEVWAGVYQEAFAMGMTPLQIVTLASIVEKETGASAERPLVASVFLNRLKAGMPLQSDPTIIYGLPDFDGNIRKHDISNPHPYNTYVHPGLPPGPICNPGRASIDAVLHPAQSDYLYFVAKGDGTHKFSTTLAEHILAVRQFQIDPLRNSAKQ